METMSAETIRKSPAKIIRLAKIPGEAEPVILEAGSTFTLGSADPLLITYMTLHKPSGLLQ